MKKLVKTILCSVCVLALAFGIYVIPNNSLIAKADETQTEEPAASTEVNLIDSFGFNGAGVATLSDGIITVNEGAVSVFNYYNGDILNDDYTYILTYKLNIDTVDTLGVFVGEWKKVEWITATGERDVYIEFKGSEAKNGGSYTVGFQIANAPATFTVSDVKLVEKAEEKVTARNYIKNFGFAGKEGIAYSGEKNEITVTETKGDFWFYSGDGLSQTEDYVLTLTAKKTSGEGGFIVYVGDWTKQANWNEESQKIEFSGSEAYIAGASSFRVGFQVANADSTIVFSDISITVANCEHSLVETEQLDATCTSTGHKAYYVCENCDLIFEDEEAAKPIVYFKTWLKEDGLLKGGHVLESGYSSDETNHWNTCENCEESVNLSAHVYDQEVVNEKYFACAATCTKKATYYKTCVCGAIGSETFESGDTLLHTYSGDWKADDAQHWHECTCGDKSDLANHVFDQEVAEENYLASAAACGKKATYYKSCVCGAVGSETFESGDEASHVYSEEWVTDNTQHWHECTCGDKSDLADHVYDQEVVDEKYLLSVATCTQKATYYKSCVCGAIGTDTFEGGETASHTYSDDWQKNDTQHWHECSCGDKSDLADHVYGEWVVIENATETETGLKEKVCECGHKITEVIPVIDNSGSNTSSDNNSVSSGSGSGCGSSVSDTASTMMVLFVNVAAVFMKRILRKR